MFLYNKKINVSALEKEIQDIIDDFIKLKLPAGFAEMVIYVLSELSANIIEHSKTKTAEIGIKIDNKQTSLTIKDHGIGIKNSYLNCLHVAKDDRSAIMLALGGLSTKNLNERAFGLYSVRKLVEYMDGTMKIESGNCAVTLSKEKMNFKEMSSKTKGVSITINTTVNSINIYDIIK